MPLDLRNEVLWWVCGLCFCEPKLTLTDGKLLLSIARGAFKRGRGASVTWP
jgi:hypothetical protein